MCQIYIPHNIRLGELIVLLNNLNDNLLVDGKQEEEMWSKKSKNGVRW